MWKTIDVVCWECDSEYIAYVDVPSGHPLPNSLGCELCEGTASRRISFNIAKMEIEERTHGPEIIGGRLVRRLTGHAAVKEQAQLRRKLKKAEKAGDATLAREVNTELSVKMKESLKATK